MFENESSGRVVQRRDAVVDGVCWSLQHLQRHDQRRLLVAWRIRRTNVIEYYYWIWGRMHCGESMLRCAGCCCFACFCWESQSLRWFPWTLIVSFVFESSGCCCCYVMNYAGRLQLLRNRHHPCCRWTAHSLPWPASKGYNAVVKPLSVEPKKT